MQDGVTWLGVGSRALFLLLEGLEQPCCQMLVGHSRACPNIDTSISESNLATRNLGGGKCPPLIPAAWQSGRWEKQQGLACQPGGSFLVFFLSASLPPACATLVPQSLWHDHLSEVTSTNQNGSWKQSLPGLPTVPRSCGQSCPKSLLRKHNKTMWQTNHTVRYCCLLWLVKALHFLGSWNKNTIKYWNESLQ